MLKVAIVFFVAVTGAYALTRVAGRIPADCDPIAEQLASYDLGNYAEPEEREPVVEKFRGMCKDESIGIDEAECIKKAHNRTGVAKCAPRLLPDVDVPDCEGTACALEGLRKHAKQACACKAGDKACIDKAMADYQKWAQDLAGGMAESGEPPKQMSAADVADMQAASKTFSECMSKAYQTP